MVSKTSMTRQTLYKQSESQEQKSKTMRFLKPAHVPCIHHLLLWPAERIWEYHFLHHALAPSSFVHSLVHGDWTEASCLEQPGLVVVVRCQLLSASADRALVWER